jgi:hypothetical protein
MKMKNTLSKHTKAQDLMHETVQKRIKEMEEEAKNEPKPMYKLKAFQTVSPKIDTYNNHRASKEESVMPSVAAKKYTKDRFNLDLSKEENMIDEILRKSKRGTTGADS